MEKLSIEEVVRKVADIVFDVTDENELEDYIKQWMSYLEAVKFPVESKAPVSFEQALRVSFLIGLLEGFINKDIIKVEKDEQKQDWCRIPS